MSRLYRFVPACALAALIASLVIAAAPAARHQPPFDVTEKSIDELQAAMTEGRVTSRDLVDAYLARIAAYDDQGPALNAVVVLNPDARADAEALDEERRTQGPRGPLHGIPVLVKDNYETTEMPTAAGSIALATSFPKRDAFLVTKLREAGAVIIGKTNMHELAAGITTISSSAGQTRNPYDLARNPGGSSGGTGAAVAASFAAAGMGSDTCGSIRIPSSHQALVGLRGTQGLSSRTGIVPLSHTQDIGGPLARTVTDLAIMLDATVGPDPADAETQAAVGHVPTSYRDALSASALRGVRIGIVRNLFGDEPEDGEVQRVIDAAIDEMTALGAMPIDIVVPDIDEMLRNGSVIVHEFKDDLAAYLETVPDAPVSSPDEIMENGLFHIALEDTFNLRLGRDYKPDPDAYRRALDKRAVLRKALVDTMTSQHVAALLYPTLRRKPARIGDPQVGSTCQVSAHSGLPALNVPAGFTDDGLPIGMELLGRPFEEAQLLGFGYALEQGAHIRRPPFSTPPLVNGTRPPARHATLVLRADDDGEGGLSVGLDLTYDTTTARLDYAVEVEGSADADRIVGLWLHRGTPAAPGPATHRLQLPVDGRSSGHLSLSFVEREAMARGALYIEMYTVRHPTGGGRTVVALQ